MERVAVWFVLGKPAASSGDSQALTFLSGWERWMEDGGSGKGGRRRRGGAG